MHLDLSHFATAALLALLASTADAQSAPADVEALTPTQVTIACAVPPDLAVPHAGGLRIIGGQNAEARRVFSQRDLLVVNGGTNAGLQLGQRFYVRRTVSYGQPSGQRPRAARTSGWIRIVALNETTAIASVDFQCGDIMVDDYLDQFAPPTVPDGVDRVDTSGQPDFASTGRILFGYEETATGGAGSFMLIDRGSNEEWTAGSRLAIYRDLRMSGVPLVSVGEAIIVSTGAETALVKITQARDAVVAGDFVVPRKP